MGHTITTRMTMGRCDGGGIVLHDEGSFFSFCVGCDEVWWGEKCEMKSGGAMMVVGFF